MAHGGTRSMIDSSSLTMTEIIRLQSQLQQELTRRFERELALVFSDIVGSTAYFARFGDAAGRELQQLHVDLLAACIGPAGGRIVDTAGDGAFIVFASAEAALDGVVAFQTMMARTNQARGRTHQLQVRVGVHWGPVLTDGVAVSGDAVNMCSRIAASADPGQVRLTRAVFQQIGSEHRLNCHALGDVALEGFAERVGLLAIDWRDPSLFPRNLRVVETGENFSLPAQDIVTFGRLLEHEGVRANDIVLTHADPTLQRRISRWHFELRRSESGLQLLALSDSTTIVDGRRIERGASVEVRAGSRICVGDALNLHLLGPERPESEADSNATLMLPPAGRSAATRSG
jgi:class 3 adenylate cyclase